MKKDNDCSGVEEEEEHEAEKRGENDEKEEEEEKEDNEEEDEDAKAHHHVEPESAEQPVTKRDRTLKNTSDEVEPPKKVNKFSLLCPATGTGLDLVECGAVAAALFGVPPASGHGERTSVLSPLPMAEEDARAKVYADEESLVDTANIDAFSGHTAPPRPMKIFDSRFEKESASVLYFTANSTITPSLLKPRIDYLHRA